MSNVKCIYCDETFQTGELLQAFLRCPEDPKGSWTIPTEVPSNFKENCDRNNDNISRIHASCLELPELSE